MEETGVETNQETAVPPPRPLAFGWIVAGYVLLFVGITWPLVLAPARLLVCRQGDGYFDMLLFWYAARGELLKPMVDSLFYPVGVPLGPEQAYWLVPYLSVPLQWVLPLPLVFNLLSCTFFVATAASMYALVRDQGVGEGGAFTAGALFVLSPAYLNELSHGIPENLCMQWLLLFVLLGRRAAAAPTALNVYGCGVSLALAWLSSWYVGLFAGMFLPLLPLKRVWPGLVLAALLLAWPMHHALSRPATPASTDRAAQDSAQRGFGHRFDIDVARALMAGTAPETHAFVGRTLAAATAEEYVRLSTTQILSNSADFEGLLARYRPGRLRDTLPGLLLIGMALLALATAPRRAAPWLAMSLVFFYLSLGPALLWGGELIGVTPTNWLFEHVPLVARMRPIRFLLGGTLCLAVVSGMAFPRLRSRAASLGVVTLLVTLAWLEVDLVHVAQYRIVLTDAQVPAAYRTLADDHPGEAVIDVPLMPYDLELGQRLYYQTGHRHPMLNYNFVTINSMEQLGEQARGNTVLAALLGEPGPLRRKDAEALAAMRFRYAILHTDMPQLDPIFDRPFLFDATLYDDLCRAYGPPREYAEDHLLLFDLQNVQPDAWDGEGRLVRRDVEQAARPPFMFVRANESAQKTMLTMAYPSGGRPYVELRGWIRGKGARVRVVAGTRTLGESEEGGRDWRWFRIPLQPTRGDVHEPALEIWADVPPACGEFDGVVLSALSLWRPASGGAAPAGSGSPPRTAP